VLTAKALNRTCRLSVRRASLGGLSVSIRLAVAITLAVWFLLLEETFRLLP